MRRWFSALLASFVLANLVAWPSAALAEVLEHELEVAQNDARTPPLEPAPVHCPHGCIGHYGQHFQWQASVVPVQALARTTPGSVLAVPTTRHPQTFASQPFRPPLGALIRS